MTNQTSPEGGSSTRRISRRSLVGAAALLGATGASGWALDRFVIEHAEVTDASAQWAATSTATATASASATTASALSSSATHTITKKTMGSGSDLVTYFVADLKLSAGTDLRAAFAKDTFGENITENPSTIAKANNASFALNGDYYGFRSDGIVIRNGVAFRDKGARQGLAILRDGTLALYDETATTAAKMLAAGAWQTMSFGPGIVNGGQVISGIESVEIDTNVGNHSIQGNQPRTGIGMIGANHLVAVVADGRSEGYSRGVTLGEFAQIFTGLGAQVAYNLDGGGSSVMYADGAVVNNPLGKGQERGVSDILFLG